jgi:hypothetical protein
MTALLGDKALRVGRCGIEQLLAAVGVAAAMSTPCRWL